MLPTILGVSTVCLAVAATATLVLWLKTRKRLGRFAEISDIDEHARRLKAENESMANQINVAKSELAKQQQAFQKYSEAVGILKSIADAQEKLRALNTQIAEHGRGLGVIKSVAEANGRLEALRRAVAEHEAMLGPIHSAREAHDQLARLNAACDQARGELGRLQETADMQSYGFYSRVFNFNTPQRYAQEITNNETSQKAMIKRDQACVCTTQWTVDGSRAQGEKMAKEQIKLMLRAFNGECDGAIARVRHGNFDTIRARIEKAYEALNKLGTTKHVSISAEFLRLKIEELVLNHELELAKEEEKERQREVRERIKEEEKAEREIAEARKKAEREEATKSKALEDARRQLADEHGKHNEKLQSLVLKLELELKDALDRKAKAIARAQLTKSGHVYILSNIGTMGEGVYKIGMTRRFEPLERIRELGDASVPFPFDVHAIIYSEDAPKLENLLHRRFADRRLNLKNNRKEYFRVSLDELRAAVKDIFGEVTFRIDHEAMQYRESEVLRQQGMAGSVPVAETLDE